MGIKVIVRFDFSRAHESIFKAHPDWFYISKKGERIINDDMYAISINAPYLQEKSIKIVEEVIDTFPIDAIFINMPGYANGSGNYLVPADKTLFKRFKEQSMLSWKFNLGLYDFSAADNTFLPILSKGKIGGHDPTAYNAHPWVETVLQEYILNKPGNLNKTIKNGMILHLINLTGFSGNTYF